MAKVAAKTKELTADRDLAAEHEAATLLVAQLRMMEKIGDNEFDDQLIADSIEGQTNLFEAIDKVIETIHWDEAMIAGIKEQEAKLEARRKRYEDRNGKRRWAIENALKLAKRGRHLHPLATIAFAQGRKDAKVEVIDESLLPAEYWRRKDPEVDKTRIGADLRASIDVPGAKLVDGEDSFRWGWK